MSTSTAAVRASTSVSTTSQFWERLWRTAGMQSVGLFVVAYFVYGNQPHVGASAEALVAFYQADRMRILIAAVLGGRSLTQRVTVFLCGPYIVRAAQVGVGLQGIEKENVAPGPSLAVAHRRP